jgi:transposase
VEALTITSERVDDLPLLAAQVERMGLAAAVDAHFPTHGGWAGLSLGGTLAVWLSHILSQADHRLSHVQPWAAQRLETLGRCFAYLGPPVRALDLADDRLAAILAALSDDGRWAAFEAALTGRLLRVYDLATDQVPRVRLDATTASGHWQVTPEGLFQFGHSKDHRPDLPQLKVMLAALDPLGLPVATDVLSGERADDPLYLPAIARVRTGMGRRGLLYVGDCKMAALETRAGIAAGGDYYLCPLPAGQVPTARLDEWLAAVARGEQALTTVERTRADGTVVAIAAGYEWTEHRQAPATTGPAAAGPGAPLVWPERWLLVRSLAHARAAEAALRDRLAKAQAALAALADRAGQTSRATSPRRRRPPRRGARTVPAAPPSPADAVRQQASAILAQYRVADLLRVTCTEQAPVRVVPAWDGRCAAVADPQAPPVVALTVSLDEAAVDRAVRRLGWRVYVTNHPAPQLSLAQAVLAYRDEYLVERSLGRLKGQPLSLTPLYLRRADHATGLVRLLSVALRVLCLLEHTVRRGLAAPAAPAEPAGLAGLYPAAPTRVIRRPTAERLLATFEGLTLTVVHLPHTVVRHVPPLSAVQQQIVALLGGPADLYARLTTPTPPVAQPRPP